MVLGVFPIVPKVSKYPVTLILLGVLGAKVSKYPVTLTLLGVLGAKVSKYPVTLILLGAKVSCYFDTFGR